MQHGTPRALPDQYGKHTRDVAYDLLRKNPDERPSARELIRDRPRLRDACASILRDAGAANGRERTPGGGGIRSTRSTRSRVRGERLRRRADGGKETSGHAPPRRRDEGRTRRAKRTDGGETSATVRALRGDARDDEEDDGTDPAFAFARSPRVVGITAAAAPVARRSCLSRRPYARNPRWKTRRGAAAVPGLDRRNRRRLRGYTRASGGPGGARG